MFKKYVLKACTFKNVMMYTNIKYTQITQSYSKTRKKMCVKTTLSVNLTDTVGKGLSNANTYDDKI